VQLKERGLIVVKSAVHQRCGSGWVSSWQQSLLHGTRFLIYNVDVACSCRVSSCQAACAKEQPPAEAM
jgi:hypothetical protein